jgi:CHAT domain
LSHVRSAFDDSEPRDPVEDREACLGRWSAAIEELLSWTWDRFVSPVIPYIGNAVRVGLMPTGRLAWLPVATARSPGQKSLAERLVPHGLVTTRGVLRPLAWPATPTAFVAADPGAGTRHLAGVVPEAQAVADIYSIVPMFVKRRASTSTAAVRASLRRATRRSLRGGRTTALAESDQVDAFVDALARVDVAHLACHFDLDTEEPLASVLRLGAGYRLEHLLDKTLERPVHLVLSGCETGLSGVRLPDEVIGPAPVLVAAGARSVTASLWPIDDAMAPGFMVSLHTGIAHGLDPASALADAQRASIALGELPLVWAAFVHHGP